MPALTNQQLVDVYTVINSKYDQIAALAGDRTSITPADLKLALASTSLSTAEKAKLKPFSNQVANSPGYWKSVANTKWHPTPNALSRPEVVSLLAAAKNNFVNKATVPPATIKSFKDAAAALKALDSKIVAALAKADILRVNELVKGYQGLLTSAVRAYDNAKLTGASAPAIAQAFGEPASLTRDSLLSFWHDRMAATVVNAVEITGNKFLTDANVQSHRASFKAGKDWLTTVDKSLINIAALGSSLRRAGFPSKTKVTAALTNLSVKLQEHFGAIFAHTFKNRAPNANEAKYLGSVSIDDPGYGFNRNEYYQNLWYKFAKADLRRDNPKDSYVRELKSGSQNNPDRDFKNPTGMVTFGRFKFSATGTSVHLWLYGVQMSTVAYLPKVSEFSLNGNLAKSQPVGGNKFWSCCND